ncbi:hypothetical protein QR680_009869 [Steinernema hermaphroditum]|uniref:Bromo domain-containing protein n=1 Tax=Steinernema hermaphroditum TaxID=289476 RepID=A0AA39INL9_9BILA|nr:hypothetical protein QR680_009869 [Steinernema hermaphroditum]
MASSFSTSLPFLECSVESSALSSTLSGGEPLGSEFLQTLETMRVIQALGQGSATDEVKEWARQRVESYTRGLPESELAVIRKNAEKIKNTMRMEQERGRPPPEPIEIPHFDEKSAKKWIYDRKRECMAVYEYASAEKSSNVFSKVVTEKKAPGYNEFIRQPQDLTSIKKLIAGKQVLDRNEIKKRIMLMYANCVMYNEEGDEYWLIAESTLRVELDITLCLEMMLSSRFVFSFICFSALHITSAKVQLSCGNTINGSLRSRNPEIAYSAYLFPPECVSCQLQRRVTETNDQIILNCNSTDDSASFGCYFREKSDWIEQVCVCNGDGCNKEIPSLDTLMNSVKVLVNWGQNVFKYDEVTVVLIASFLGACLLQEQLIPVIYRALKSWSLCPLYCNWKISRTITQDVRKYMLSHDIPPLDQRDVHALGDSLWESISRKSGSSFRSYEDRTYRFEREVREEITRNDLLCRRAGYLRQCQNRMMMNDMTRIRCTDQLIKNLQQGIPPTAPIPDHAKKRSEQRKVDEDKPMAITQSSSIIRPNTAKMPTSWNDYDGYEKRQNAKFNIDSTFDAFSSKINRSPVTNCLPHSDIAVK